MHKEKTEPVATPHAREHRPEEIAEKRIAEWRMDPVERNPRLREMHGVRFGHQTRILNLEDLGLKAVPEGIRHLRGLETLNLGHNKIRSLPAWIGELGSLKALNLDANLLRQLPEQIGALRALRVIWLSRNRLKALPESLRGLSLREIALRGNPGLGVPESILQRPPEEILRYYFESRAEAGRPLLELKLLLVGRGQAGKTTLVKRLAGLTPDKDEDETHSIGIHELTLKCPRGQVRARAWDFGGQEILHSTHQFFLTPRSLYLLVLEPRTNAVQRDAEYWLKLIETQGESSPVIVVLNKSRGNPWQVNQVKLQRKFPFVFDFVSTDARHGDGIRELRRVMLKAVEQRMPDVWQSFPERWREIKDAVAGMRGNFLTFKQYSELCARFGEESEAAQADLAGILHALGLALYFGKDPRLHDTRVLNPRWVTGGVYAVLRAPSVKRSGGQLAVADMPRVLREAQRKKVIEAKDYPPRTHQFILELMRSFQLCYASEEEKGRPTRYLVPELLTEQEPEMEERWDNAPLRLRYRYQVLLPPGLLPRFIVRTHTLGDGGPRWRYGVVLRLADSQTLIREESDRAELHVFVLGGDDETRRVLAAMVRRELETLHAELKLKPVEELELSGDGEHWISVSALRESEVFGEPKKKQRLAVQPEGTAEVDVRRELDKLMPASARAIEHDPDTAPVPVRLFVCYASDDERYLKPLTLILDYLEQRYELAPWSDKRLLAGQQWDEEIRQRLEEMDIFLFIASMTSLVRPYIQDPELRRARERHENGEVEIVLVKLEPSGLDEDPYLGKLQRLAPGFKSVAETSPKSAVWDQVRKDLLPVIRRVREKKLRGKTR